MSQTRFPSHEIDGIKQNYYQILGISSSASAKEIRAAYRNLTLKWHPDKLQDYNNCSKAYTQKELAKKYSLDDFKIRCQIINSVYETLKDLQKKREYDANLDANLNNPVSSMEEKREETRKNADKKRAEDETARQAAEAKKAAEQKERANVEAEHHEKIVRAIREGNVQTIKDSNWLNHERIIKKSPGQQSLLELAQQVEPLSEEKREGLNQDKTAINEGRQKILDHFWQHHKPGYLQDSRLGWYLNCRQDNKATLARIIDEIEKDYLKEGGRRDFPYEIILWTLLKNLYNNPKIMPLVPVLIERCMSPPKEVVERYKQSADYFKKTPNLSRYGRPEELIAEQLLNHFWRNQYGDAERAANLQMILKAIPKESKVSESLLVALLEINEFDPEKFRKLAGLLLSERTPPYVLNTKEVDLQLGAERRYPRMPDYYRTFFLDIPEILMGYEKHGSNRRYIDHYKAALLSLVTRFCDKYQSAPEHALQPMIAYFHEIQKKPEGFFERKSAERYVVFGALIASYESSPSSLPKVISELQRLSLGKAAGICGMLAAIEAAFFSAEAKSESFRKAR